MSILVNKPTSVSADSTTSLELNKTDLQAKLVALGAGAYWENQATWKGVAFLFENASKQKAIAVFNVASGVTTNLSVSEYFVDGAFECKRIDVLGFANDFYTIYRSDFGTASEFDITITDGYASGGGGGGGDITPELISNGDFEQGDTNWFFANSDQTNKWKIGTAAFFSGTKSLYVSNTEGSTATYSNTVSNSWAWTHFVVPQSKPKIRFKIRINAEYSSTTFFDFVTVSVKYDNSNLLDASSLAAPTSGSDSTGGGVEIFNGKIKSVQNYETSSTWLSYEIDLTGSVVGNLGVRLLFNWKNDALIAGSFSASIDDIELFTESSPQTPLTWARTSGHTTEVDGGIYGGPSSNYWAASSQVIPNGQDGEFTFLINNFNTLNANFTIGVGKIGNETTNIYFGIIKTSNNYLLNNSSITISYYPNISTVGLCKVQIAREGSLMKIKTNGMVAYEIPVGTAYTGDLVAAVRTFANPINTGVVAAYKSI